MVFYIGQEHVFAKGESVAAPLEVDRIRGYLSVSGEFAPEPRYWLDAKRPFRAVKPVSEMDAVEGAVCAASKMWFPAHRLVYVGGLPYGDRFAPQGEEF